MSLMKEHDKIIARDQNKMEIITMHDGELKVMIIEILTGLEERVENLSETLNHEVRNNQPDMKNTINEIKITLDVINSKLYETEE